MNMLGCIERIPSYEPAVASIAHDRDRSAKDWEHECAAIGGFNPCTGNITKICCVNDAFIGEHLDHVTAAVECGLVSRAFFVEQLFASREDFRDFVRFLRTYPGRVHDRWHQALSALAAIEPAQAGLVSTQEVLTVLAEF